MKKVPYPAGVSVGRSQHERKHRTSSSSSSSSSVGSNHAIVRRNGWGEGEGKADSVDDTQARSNRRKRRWKRKRPAHSRRWQKLLVAQSNDGWDGGRGQGVSAAAAACAMHENRSFLQVHLGYSVVPTSC
ncbi:hypothetical protein ZHAS_00010698 [Anopheles sinensis]|uniref:Uncharacterized protein n=1 Tax=Anopheles sinensis TaxID=74873 RepID=A0A084VYI1_ANOSI|nr:hypothetical protein ZHAS_00010698 [Anopheles sinensis]